MEEIEKFFECPSCFEKISMLLDVSTEGEYSYIEDCEVCCNPIQLEYKVLKHKLQNFSAVKAYD